MVDDFVVVEVDVVELIDDDGVVADMIKRCLDETKWEELGGPSCWDEVLLHAVPSQ